VSGRREENHKLREGKRREEKSGKRQGTKNFSLQIWGGRKILQFQGWRRGGREQNLEDEIVLGVLFFLISVSFVINPVQGGGILSEEEKSVRDQRIAVDCIHVGIVPCCF
jgi:hypothetical protein